MILYKRRFTLPLRCFSEEEVDYVIREIHEGIYRRHSGGRVMAHKAIKAGYYWPLMQNDATLLTHKCDKCQIFANIPKVPAEELVPITGPWPFAQWKINIVGSLLMEK